MESWSRGSTAMPRVPRFTQPALSVGIVIVLSVAFTISNRYAPRCAAAGRTIPNETAESAMASARTLEAQEIFHQPGDVVVHDDDE